MKAICRALTLIFFANFSFAEHSSLFAQPSASEIQTGGYVTFTFDDVASSQFEFAYPILQVAGFPATLYVNTQMVDGVVPGFMTWDDIRTVMSGGWEIGAHTVTHPALTTLSDIGVVGELVLSRDRIEAEVGVEPITFASPYGEYNDQVLGHIQRYFESHVRAWGQNTGVNPSGISPYLIERVNIDNRLTAEAICDVVRNVEAGEWLVLMFHHIGYTSDEYMSSPDQLDSIVQCVTEALTANNLIVGTVSEILLLKEEETRLSLDTASKD